MPDPGYTARPTLPYQPINISRFFTLILYSVKSLLILSSHHLFNSLTGYPVIRPAGYPANETGYPAGYRISKKAEYPASRISGTTLSMILPEVCEELSDHEPEDDRIVDL